MTLIAAHHASVRRWVVFAGFGQCAVACVVLADIKFVRRHPRASLYVDFVVTIGLGKGIDVESFHVFDELWAKRRKGRGTILTEILN